MGNIREAMDAPSNYSTRETQGTIQQYCGRFKLSPLHTPSYSPFYTGTHAKGVSGEGLL